MKLVLVRHGDTEWSPFRRLAGRTNLLLTEAGEANAGKLGDRLAKHGPFDRVYTSPLDRAKRTAVLAGYPDALVDERLIEMDFGSYEGQTVQEIRVQRPGYAYLKDGAPNGEDAAALGRRADGWLADQNPDHTILVFAHSVILRVLTARYLQFPPEGGRHFFFAPAAIAVLGWEPVDDAPAIQGWNL
ncbi:MAG: histidine phosphatase family protein [Kofleriaceae bacterium]